MSPTRLAMPGGGPDFVKWREEFVSQERGSRVVHYYLEDVSGASHLAVVGTERSLRHMLYVVSGNFCRDHGFSRLGASALKWRSRREVVDWLTKFLPEKDFRQKFPKSAPAMGDDIEVNGFGENGGYLCKYMVTSQDKGCSSDIVWTGDFWTCGKQLRHYRAFYRNGTTISAHSFVLVMSEEESSYLAYLEDMYEDKKGQKKVKVRWFHQNQEFTCTIPPPAPHPSEVFITPYSQVISVECVDDVATVLTPEHYQKCSSLLPYSSSSGMHLCFRQYSKNKFKFFDLQTLCGYFNQAALLCLRTLTEKGKVCPNIGGPKKIRFSNQHQRLYANCLGTKISGFPDHNNTQSVGRSLFVKPVVPQNQLTMPYKIGEKIELLCQDSGIRGCWFKCTVLQASHKRLKVQYDDLQSVDGCGSLEEWVPGFRLAATDKLGMRCSGRLTIRPSSAFARLSVGIPLSLGSAVDVWWNDGWWEGVVVCLDSSEDDNCLVYFPGEDRFLTCQCNNMRISRDWVGNRWVDIEAKPEILSRVILTSPGISTKGAESGSSAMSDREGGTKQASSSEEDKQAEASLSCGTNTERENQVNLHKHRRDEDTEENGEDEVALGGGGI